MDRLKECQRLLDAAAEARREHDKLGGITALPKDDPQALGDFLSDHLTAINERLARLEGVLHEVVGALVDENRRKQLEKRNR